MVEIQADYNSISRMPGSPLQIDSDSSLGSPVSGEDNKTDSDSDDNDLYERQVLENDEGTFSGGSSAPEEAKAQVTMAAQVICQGQCDYQTPPLPGIDYWTVECII